jgi:hypothetical protein
MDRDAIVDGETILPMAKLTDVGAITIAGSTCQGERDAGVLPIMSSSWDLQGRVNRCWHGG